VVGPLPRSEAKAVFDVTNLLFMCDCSPKWIIFNSMHLFHCKSSPVNVAAQSFESFFLFGLKTHATKIGNPSVLQTLSNSGI